MTISTRPRERRRLGCGTRRRTRRRRRPWSPPDDLPAPPSTTWRLVRRDAGAPELPGNAGDGVRARQRAVTRYALANPDVAVSLTPTAARCSPRRAPATCGRRPGRLRPVASRRRRWTPRQTPKRRTRPRLRLRPRGHSSSTGRVPRDVRERASPQCDATVSGPSSTPTAAASGERPVPVRGAVRPGGPA